MKNVAMNVLALGICFLVGCGTTPADPVPDHADFVPDHADRLVLYMINSTHSGRMENILEGAELFHGWLVLGKAEIESDSEKAKILRALIVDINNGKEQAKCFDPNHAIRITDGNKIIDLVICYQCNGFEGYDHIAENSKITNGGPIDIQSRELINELLRSHGIELSKDARIQLSK